MASVITCRVHNGEGRPLAGARVFFVSGPGAFPEIAALTGADGSAVLAAPTPGAYALQVVADGFAPRTAPVTVAAGEEATLEVVLERA